MGTLTLTRAQFEALVHGLPWQRIGEARIIQEDPYPWTKASGDALLGAQSRRLVHAAILDASDTESGPPRDDFAAQGSDTAVHGPAAGFLKPITTRP